MTYESMYKRTTQPKKKGHKAAAKVEAESSKLEKPTYKIQITPAVDEHGAEVM